MSGAGALARGVVAAAGIAALTAAAPAADEHPLYPGTRAVLPTTMRADGVPPADAAAPPVAGSAASIRAGRALYDVHCITCHGADLAGTSSGPSLRNAGGAAADFFVSTGRMPLAVPGVQGWHEPDLFDARQTAALVDYITARAATSQPIPTVKTDPALLQRGRFLFEQHCEACHGAAAQGADAGFGWIALPLDRASPRQIGEAIRIGPGIMPVFTAAELSDRDVDAIATYVQAVVTAPVNPGGTPFAYLGPLAEGAIAWFIGIGGLFFVIYFTGTTARGARLGRRP